MSNRPIVVSMAKANPFGTEYKNSHEIYSLGDVIRLDSQDFPDAVITGFVKRPGELETWVAVLARPYARANSVGSCIGHLVGVEEFEMLCKHLNRFNLIAKGRTV